MMITTLKKKISKYVKTLKTIIVSYNLEEDLKMYSKKVIGLIKYYSYIDIW